MSNFTVDEILMKLAAIFQEVFDDDNLVITSSSTSQDVDGWDSLAHIRLIVTIEKVFSVRLTAREVSSLNNVGDIASLVFNKLQK